MPTTTANRANGSKRKAEWAKRTVHTVTLPSGFECKIRIPNIALLIKNDAIPQQLRAVALREVVNPGAPLATPESDDGQAVTETMLRDLYDLYEWLVTQTVVEPELTVEDLPDLPQEDLDMLTQIATRERDTDARGVRLGVARLSDWEAFRSEHRCPPDCEACERALDALSTVDVG